MREAGTKYLPQEPKENEVNYRNRLTRSTLTNFYNKTADMVSAKITRKDPKLLDGTPQQIVDIEENIDNMGNSISQFTEMALTHSIDDGVVFVFVDSPKMPATTVGEEDPDAPPRTRAQDEAMGLRPYVRLIQAKDLIGWKHKVVDGRPVLEQIRIHETTTRPSEDDPFNDEEVERIRVVEPFIHTVWEKVKDNNGKESWVIVETVITEFEQIPLVPLYTNYKKFLVGEPLYLDLAYMNVNHWQSDSDQTNIVHVIRNPILFGQGLSETGEEVVVAVGPNSMVTAPIGSDLKYVEHSGKAAEVGYVQLERLEANIVTMGGEIIMNKRTGNPTATARALDQAEMDSEMAAISTAIEDMWREVFVFLAEAFGVEVTDAENVGVNMNKDFSLGMRDVQAVSELLKMRQTGDISQSTLWFELQRMGMLSEDFDSEEETALLDVESEEKMDREATLMSMMTEASIPSEGGNQEEEDDNDE